MSAHLLSLYSIEELSNELRDLENECCPCVNGCPDCDEATVRMAELRAEMDARVVTPPTAG